MAWRSAGIAYSLRPSARFCFRDRARAFHRLVPPLSEALRPRGPPKNQDGGTIASALAMRLARYIASDTYYPQTISILRLDRLAAVNVFPRADAALTREF